MNIKEFIQEEITNARNIIKKELKEGAIKEGDLADFIDEVNNMLDEVIYTHIRDSVTFDLKDKLTGNYYKSMLGNGKQIDYLDLYEILKRLYNYHHSSQEFTIQFEEYSVNINYDILGETPNNRQIFNAIMVSFGDGNYFKVSDFQ